MYVLVKGFPGQALLMLLLSGLIFATIGILAVLVALWSNSSAGIRILSFAALLGLGLAVHGYFAVELTRRGFLRLGYRARVTASPVTAASVRASLVQQIQFGTRRRGPAADTNSVNAAHRRIIRTNRQPTLPDFSGSRPPTIL